MTLIGYARVSTQDQDLTVQEEALRRAGCELIRSEHASGSTVVGRRELEVVRAFLRRGDTLVVTRVDRLARSVEDLQRIVRELKERGVGFRATEQNIDTATASGKAFLDMLGVFAEFERNLTRERQAEGIARARAEGKYKGRPPTLKPEEIRRLKAEGLNPYQIAKKLGIARSSVYRLLEDKTAHGSAPQQGVEDQDHCGVADEVVPAHASSPSSALVTAARTALQPAQSQPSAKGPLTFGVSSATMPARPRGGIGGTDDFAEAARAIARAKSRAP